MEKKIFYLSFAVILIHIPIILFASEPPVPTPLTLSSSTTSITSPITVPSSPIVATPILRPATLPILRSATRREGSFDIQSPPPNGSQSLSATNKLPASSQHVKPPIPRVQSDPVPASPSYISSPYRYNRMSPLAAQSIVQAVSSTLTSRSAQSAMSNASPKLKPSIAHHHGYMNPNDLALLPKESFETLSCRTISERTASYAKMIKQEIAVFLRKAPDQTDKLQELSALVNLMELAAQRLSVDIKSKAEAEGVNLPPINKKS